MACINALAFSVAHRDFPEEVSFPLYPSTFKFYTDSQEVLVRELSKVKEHISNGLSYFTVKSSDSNKPALKDQVQRFLTKLSTFLNLSEERCFDLLVHYIAARDTDGPFDEDQVQNFITDGHVSDLLNRIRIFYWQERLSLLGLFRVMMCDWHESWVTLADVLFAMTSFRSRTEFLEHMLHEYTQAACATESLLTDGRYGFMRLTQPTVLVDFESQDEFDLAVAQRLKEQLEMLHIIFTGVHALSDADAPPASCFFSKLLDAFWSKSFGLQPSHVQPLAKHRHLADQICLTQTLILIRAANLDNLTLFKNVSTKPGPESMSGPRAAKRSTKRSNQDASINHESTGGHFLYNAHLLNRLLASLSALGDSPVHGPLLLFGAICATAFAPSVAPDSPPHRLDAGDLTPGDWGPVVDERKPWGGGNPGRDGGVEVSETAHLVAEQYAHMAIQTLGVFGFLTDQLTDLGKPIQNRPGAGLSLNLQESPLIQPGTDLNVIDFCAHVAVFDLLCLLAQHVVLWTLDSPTSAAANSIRSEQSSNRIACIRLFAHTLYVVAQHVHLITRAQDASDAPSSGIGLRIAGLIESLAEGFPCDLSLVHLCTALMVPAPSRGSQTDNGGAEESDSLVHLVSELITALPYLTEPFTPELQRVVQQSSASLYPQFGRGDQFASNNDVYLTQTRTVLSVDWRQRSGSISDRNRYATPSALYAGIRLMTGTVGKVETDLGWISWKQEYPVWNVISFEVEKALILLDRIRSCLGSGQCVIPQTTPPRIKAGRIVRESSYRTDGTYTLLYTTLFEQLTRVQQLLQFMTACVAAQVHISSCLYLLEDVWLLIQRVLNLSTELTELWRTKTNTVPTASILDFLYDQMIPSVLRLLGYAFMGISATGTAQLLTEHANLWNSILLTEMGRFFPRLVLTRTGQISQ
ncbi:unnamed protein product [Echinostoma caproni]|uniref:UDENN domain-containing protein n=1 Tax=Echinostoma caproni TaxID=27848 RepID=A0A183B6N1_9TREM|nr:unnamed protein product [Echinostoma caproni]